MCKKKSHPVSSKRHNSDTVVTNYHVSSRTAEAVRRLSFETGETEGRVIDKIVRTHLASIEDMNKLAHDLAIGGDNSA